MAQKLIFLNYINYLFTQINFYIFYLFYFFFINRSAKYIINELGMKPKNYEYDIGMIAGQLILFKVLAYISLKRRLKGD